MGNGMNKVLEGVYVGSIRDSKDQNQLKENKITHILSIHDNAAMVKSDIEYLCIAARDCTSQDLTPYFCQSNDFIHQARLKGGRVLIHCLAGVSRSVTLTVVYIMTVTGVGWRDALNTVRGARTAANPNFGFQRQLSAFEHDTLPQERARLLGKYPDPLPHNDVARCRDLLEKHREWVLHGDAGRDSDDNTYPLPHRAYSQRAANRQAGFHGEGAAGAPPVEVSVTNDEKSLDDYLNIKAEREAKQHYKRQESMDHIRALREKRASLPTVSSTDLPSASTTSTGKTSSARSTTSPQPSYASSSTTTPSSSTSSPPQGKKPARSPAPRSGISATVSAIDPVSAPHPSIVISVPSPSPKHSRTDDEDPINQFFQ